MGRMIPVENFSDQVRRDSLSFMDSTILEDLLCHIQFCQTCFSSWQLTNGGYGLVIGIHTIQAVQTVDTNEVFHGRAPKNCQMGIQLKEELHRMFLPGLDMPFTVQPESIDDGVQQPVTLDEFNPNSMPNRTLVLGSIFPDAYMSIEEILELLRRESPSPF